MAEPLWRPSPERIAQASITEFIKSVNAGWGGNVLVDGDKMPGAQWFPDARLNFAKNLLRRRDGSEAIVFWGEDKVRRRLTHGEFYDQVSVLAQALADVGVEPGFRIAGYIPNMPEAACAMLAAVSIGAVWSSCSPDFGVQGVLDRFRQIEPKVLFAAEGYYYNGKTHDCLDKLADIVRQLPAAGKTPKKVVIPYMRPAPNLAGIQGAVMIGDFVAGFEPGDIAFKRMPFKADHLNRIAVGRGKL